MIHADKSTASAPETAGTNSSRTEAKTPPSSKRKPVKAEPVKKRPATAKTTARGTKKAKLLSLLRRPNGASLDQLTKASGWQAHSVRASFLAPAMTLLVLVRVAATSVY